MRDQLVRAKGSGVRRAQGPVGGVEYVPDDEFRKKLADLDAQIAAASGTTPPSFTLATHSRD
jgi:hypothetical protein